MTQSQPSITGTTHTLPFDKLSPRDFERLCLWLVEREGPALPAPSVVEGSLSKEPALSLSKGYERAEHLGAAGSEQGRDIVAWREGQLWAFQCKRVQRFGPKDALAEVEKVLALPEDQRPVGLVFLVTCDVSANTRQQVRDRCAGEMECDFWAGTELDEKVKRHLGIVEEFFQADQGSTTVEHKAHLEGSGAVVQGSGVAVGERGVAITGDARQPVILTGDRNVVTVIYQGVEVAVPSPDAVARHRATLRERLEAEARACWGGMPAYIQEEGATLSIEASPYQTGRLGPRENLLRMLHAADRLLVLGEPGSGKTVSLERLAWELCSGLEPTVPVLVRLFHYDGTPLAAWVQALLQETGCLRLDDFIGIRTQRTISPAVPDMQTYLTEQDRQHNQGAADLSADRRGRVQQGVSTPKHM